MADMSKSPNCHVCNISLKRNKAQKLECSHQLCCQCIQLTEGRSVCPTCSPAASPYASNATNDIPPLTRMFSNNTEQPPAKLPPSSKKINAEFKTCTPINSSAILPSRLAVPPSFPSAGSSSNSSSPSTAPCPRLAGRATSNDSCIVERIDYVVSVDNSTLDRANDRAEDPVRQGWRRLVADTEAGHQPDLQCGDGRRGTGSVRRDLAEYARTLREHSVAFFEKLNQTGIDEAIFIEKIAAAEKEIMRLAKERRQAIDRAEKELLWKLESRRNELLLESGAVRQDIELCLGQLDSLTKTIGDAAESGDEGGLDQVLFKVQGDVRRELEHRIPTVNFGSVSLIYCPESFLHEDRMNVLGEIEFPPNADRADDHSMFLSSPPPLIHSIDHSSGQAVVGLTVLADRIYVTRDHSHYIEVCHANYFTALPPLSLLHLKTPMLVPAASDLSSCPSSQTLYVADTVNACFYRLDTDGKLLTHWKLPKNYTGLSVTATGTILAGSIGKIHEYDQTGKMLRTIGRLTLTKVSAKRRNNITLDTPRHFVRRASGSIVVCDWNNNKTYNHFVCVVDDRDQMGSCFGGEPGEGDGDLNEPCCLATAPLDHVIVADRVNRRVKLLDSDLNFVRNLVDSHQLGCKGQPNRVFLDVTTGRLYVGLTDGRILIYRVIL